MTRKEIISAVNEGHPLHDADLRGADLRGADLRGADLRGADLRGADLRGADLHRADLRGADLRGADLRWAGLRGADLRGADLRWADLHRADLHDADLSGTCLDPVAPVPGALQELAKAGLAKDEDGFVTAWRTVKSPVLGGPGYELGREYVAPVFSVDSTTECHPGLYVWTRQAVEDEYPGEPLIKVRFRADECVASGGKFRVKRFKVLEET